MDAVQRPLRLVLDDYDVDRKLRNDLGLLFLVDLTGAFGTEVSEENGRLVGRWR